MKIFGKGFCSDEEIEELKKVHKTLFRYISKFKKDEIIFVPLKREQTLKAAELVLSAEVNNEPIPVYEIYKYFFDSCVVWPQYTEEEINNLPTGVVPSTAALIQEKSGYFFIDATGRVVGNPVFVTPIKDYDVWPDITPEELDVLCKSTSFLLAKCVIGKWIFFIRPMTRIDIQVSVQSADDQLTLAKAVTMWPKDINWEELPSGVVEIIGKKSSDISGWDMSSTVEVVEVDD